MVIDKSKQKIIEKIVKKYSLRLLLLFGSQVDGKTHKHSDFDVAYLSCKNLDLREDIALSMELFYVFKSDKVDLVNLRKASPLLYYGIFRKAQVLYEAEKYLFFNLRAYAFKKFVEHMPLYELKRQRLKRELNHIKI